MTIGSEIIYLKDFYNDKFYMYDYKNIVSSTESIDESKISGYFSREPCGLIKKKYIEIGYFQVDEKDFLLINNASVPFVDISFEVKTILPFFIKQIVIKLDHKKIECLQSIIKKEDIYATNIFQVILDKAGKRKVPGQH